jgi:hypothetical protein
VSGRGAALALAGWAALNAALAGLLLGFRHNWVQVAEYWATPAFVLLLALVALRSRDRPRRVVPDASAGAAVLALGIALLAIGAGFGLWAALLGAGLVLVALALLARERAG